MSNEHKQEAEPISDERKSEEEPVQHSPPSDEDPSNDSETIKDISDSMTTLSSNVEELNQTIQKRLSYDATKEEAFNRLYTELDEFKRNSAFEAVKPLYIDLILLFDRIDNTRQSITSFAKDENRSSPSVETTDHAFINILSTLCDELLEILYRREIELIEKSSSAFDPTVQRAIGTDPTTIEEEHEKIARVVRRGFKFQDRVLRAEEVIIKKCQKPKEVSV